MSEIVSGLFFNPEAYADSLNALLTDALKISPTAVATTSMAISRRIDHKPLVKAHASEITILQGTQDPIIDAAAMQIQLAGLKLKFIEMDDVGHMAHIEAKEALELYIMHFTAV